MPSSPTPFVVEPAGWRARIERLLDGVARQRVAVAFVAVLALAAAGILWLNAQPRAADPPPSAASGSGGTALVLPRADAAGGATVPGQPAAGQATGATIAVDVVGRVQRPGLVRLPPGSRVLDAIEAAGGTASGADLESVNLARKVVDGEQIRIPRHGEALPQSPDAAAGGAAGPGGTGASGAAGQSGVPLDLNTATAEQLDTLPGIGEVTANQIIAYRTAHPFRSVDDLRQVPGIGDRRFDVLKDLVTVSGGS
ncbi:MAG TPA: ComEA family DNA-binding protein [Actinomycetes bacterium]|nr:ComEA family DNA-binding protein [Actinomycetes bacterium]